jgi:hypothetical protein
MTPLMETPFGKRRAPCLGGDDMVEGSSLGRGDEAGGPLSSESATAVSTKTAGGGLMGDTRKEALAGGISKGK